MNATPTNSIFYQIAGENQQAANSNLTGPETFLDALNKGLLVSLLRDKESEEV